MPSEKEAREFWERCYVARLEGVSIGGRFAHQGANNAAEEADACLYAWRARWSKPEEQEPTDTIESLLREIGTMVTMKSEQHDQYSAWTPKSSLVVAPTVIDALRKLRDEVRK